MRKTKIDKRSLRGFVNLLGAGTVKRSFIYNLLEINIDGTDISGATIDGQEVQEITVDGDTVYTAFQLIDDFEHNNISRYSGDVSNLNANIEGSASYEGNYGLNVSRGTGPDKKMYDTNSSVSQGDAIQYHQRLNSGYDGHFIFGVRNFNYSDDFDGYQIALKQRQDRVRLRRHDGGSTTDVWEESVNINKNWHTVKIYWETDGSIRVVVEQSGKLLDKTVTDNNYTSGYVGYGCYYANVDTDLVKII